MGTQISTPERAVAVFNVITQALERHARVQANMGKCKMWNACGEEPHGIDALTDHSREEGGGRIWVGGHGTLPAERGIIVLGSPLGSAAFVQAALANTLEEQGRLLTLLPQLPDLQCAWILLSMCAAPRSNHTLRTVPPPLSAAYAHSHDARVWQCLRECLEAQAVR